MMNDLLNLLSDDQDYNVNAEKLFIHKYNKIFNQYTLTKDFSIKKVIKFFKEEYKISNDNILYSNERFHGSVKKKAHFTSFYIIELKDELLIELSFGRYIKFLYHNIEDKQFIEKLTNEIPFKTKKKDVKYFYMAVRADYTYSGLELKKFKVKKMGIEIKKHFNDDFHEVDSQIKRFLDDKDKNGIVILHGKPGTGKSSYIRHLINNTNQKFVYFPLFLLDSINSPDLLNFLSENKNSILILEDCENSIKSRTNVGNDNGLVNLLNLSDGLLGDALQMKIICTFNADMKSIDKALLRKGRLFVSYEFKPLEIVKAKNLLQEISSLKEVNKPMTLSDIYNDCQINSFEQTKKGIGFDNK